MNQFKKLARLKVEVASLSTLLFKIDSVVLYAILKFANGKDWRRWSHDERCGGDNFDWRFWPLIFACSYLTNTML